MLKKKFGMWFVTVLITMSCDGGTIGPTKIGDLSNGYFIYECSTAYDIVCWDHCPWFSDCDDIIKTSNGFPDKIAVGSRFEVRYKPQSSSDDIANVVVPVSSTWLSVEGDSFVANKTGTSSLIARAVQGGAVLDYTHVHVVEPTGIVVSTTDGDAVPTTLTKGQQVDWIVYPVDVWGDPLAGSLTWTWTVENPTIVDYTGFSGSPERTIHALATGTTKIVVEVAGIKEELTITVHGSGTDDVVETLDVSDDVAEEADAGAPDTASDTGIPDAEVAEDAATTETGDAVDGGTNGD